MSRKFIISVLLVVLAFSQLCISPAGAQNESEPVKIKVRAHTGFGETRGEFIAQSLIQGVVIEETKERKKKRLLPFLLWTGTAWLTLDYIRNQHGGNYEAVDEDEFFANLDLRCLERITDATISKRILPDSALMSSDVLVETQKTMNFQNGYPENHQPQISWQDGLLIGRMHPIYVSVFRTGNSSVNLLVAGLDKLHDGQILIVDVYDTNMIYTVELNSSDSDSFGVFKTRLELDSSLVHLSIETVR